MNKITIGDTNSQDSVLVIGGIHGDEPCGVNAIRSVLESDITVSKEVTFIIANEKALSHNTRYINTDLNRLFPTSEHTDKKHTHEFSIAEAIETEIQKASATLVFHSTHSSKEPFALFGELTPTTRKVLSGLSLSKACKESKFTNGAITTFNDLIEVECGFQKSQDATDNAEKLLYEFLTVTNALNPRSSIYTDVMIFERTGRLSKPQGKRYSSVVDNFTKIKKGEPIAQTAQGDKYIAYETFYPILVSGKGYEEILGFKGQKLGWLSEL